MSAINIFSRIIQHLENVRKRPYPFIGGRSEEAVSTYLAGFHTAARLCGYDLDEHVFWIVCAERGWEINSLGPQKRMRDAGWTEEAILDEVLVIEIETWKRMLTNVGLPLQRG